MSVDPVSLPPVALPPVKPQPQQAQNTQKPQQAQDTQKPPAQPAKQTSDTDGDNDVESSDISKGIGGKVNITV